MRTVAGLFENRTDVDRALDALHAQGFTRDQISVVMSERTRAVERGGVDRSDMASEETAEAAGAGAVGGTVLGGLAGLLIGVGALAIPGIGPVIAAGPLSAAIGSAAAATGMAAAGAGIGAATGGIIGGLVGAGFTNEEANLYAEGVKRGGILVTVQANEAYADNAAGILRQYGAVDIHSQGQTWRESGWSDFDSNTMPDENYPTLDPYRRNRPL